MPRRSRHDGARGRRELQRADEARGHAAEHQGTLHRTRQKVRCFTKRPQQLNVYGSYVAEICCIRAVMSKFTAALTATSTCSIAREVCASYRARSRQAT